MQPKQLVFTLAAASAMSAAADTGTERIVGVYIFHRHGDRTAKDWAPVSLTALGADQVYSSGDFYRRRYLSSDSPQQVSGISAQTAVLSQLSITSPNDAVLHNSALGFVQGLYPPSGRRETLANGSDVQSPLGGYQYVPVDAVGQASKAATASKAESAGWLQGSSGCDAGVASSNSYFASDEYKATLADTADFYRDLLPVINTTYDAARATFKNGYTIFDYINVATIHNTSIPSSNLLTPPVRARLFDLASTHEWNLAYNASESEPLRAVAGAVLAGQVLASLQALADGTKSAAKISAQFGAYGTFMAFFGLANLQSASNDFYGICDYASSMAFELFTTTATNTNANTKPDPSQLRVRFLFANGTTAYNELRPFALFGQQATSLAWPDFRDAMAKFAVSNTTQWCRLCGATSASCANVTDNGTGTGTSTSTSKQSDGHGVSRPVAGVIGALVTLVVILGIQAAVLLLGGLRLVKKSTARLSQVPETGVIKGQ